MLHSSFCLRSLLMIQMFKTRETVEVTSKTTTKTRREKISLRIRPMLTEFCVKSSFNKIWELSGVPLKVSSGMECKLRRESLSFCNSSWKLSSLWAISSLGFSDSELNVSIGCTLTFLLRNAIGSWNIEWRLFTQVLSGDGYGPVAPTLLIKPCGLNWHPVWRFNRALSSLV